MNWLGKHSLEIPIRLTKGFVMGEGHRVQHYRIRESLIRTDPAGMMDHWAQTVRSCIKFTVLLVCGILMATTN